MTTAQPPGEATDPGTNVADPQNGDGGNGARGARPRPQVRADRAEAVNRLIEAASGLASTIAVTERLAQQRADLVASRATLLGPRREAAAQTPIISLAEAARRSGRHPEVLRRWCMDGRIPAVRIGRTWGITTETLALLMAHAARSRPRLPTRDRA